MRKLIKRVAMSGSQLYDNLYVKSVAGLNFWYREEFEDTHEYVVELAGRRSHPSIALIRIDESGWHNTIKELFADWVASVADEGECEVLACDFIESTRKVGPFEFVHNRTSHGYCSLVGLFLLGKEVFGLDKGD